MIDKHEAHSRVQTRVLH